VHGAAEKRGQAKRDYGRCDPRHRFPGAERADLADCEGGGGLQRIVVYLLRNQGVLLNALYVELKTEMAIAALAGLPTGKDVRDQMASMWNGWLRWAMSDPDKRRTLAQLAVSDEITPKSRDIGRRAMAAAAVILERSRANGPMRTAPLGLVAGLMNAVADATVEFIVQDPANADSHTRVGFEALWRMIA
jgi:hypothetical protein